MKKLVTFLLLALLIGCGGSSTNPGPGDGSDNGELGGSGDNGGNGGDTGGDTGGTGGDEGGEETQKDLTPEEILAKLKEDGNTSYDVNPYEYLKGTWTMYLFPDQYLGVTQEPQDIVIDEDGYTENYFMIPLWFYKENPYVYGESHYTFDNCSDLVTNYPQESQDIIETPNNGPILFDYSQQIIINGINDPEHFLSSYLRGTSYDYCCSNQVDGCADYDLPEPNQFLDNKNFPILGINIASKQRAFYIEYDDPHPQTPVYEILFVRQD